MWTGRRYIARNVVELDEVTIFAMMLYENQKEIVEINTYKN